MKSRSSSQFLRGGLYTIILRRILRLINLRYGGVIQKGYYGSGDR